ncbi:MAG TPA: hypothetical protein VHM88_15275, partial [Candidatus Acidoferrales bacterium]|nr:hypothetical protein [Candidatus Acidoferrales bacterium]
LRQQFHLSRVVLVGDRGMLTQPKIEKLKEHSGLGWITALTSVAIQRLVAERAWHLSRKLCFEFWKIIMQLPRSVIETGH